jgi:hypothetical protein
MEMKQNQDSLVLRLNKLKIIMRNLISMLKYVAIIANTLFVLWIL